MRQAVAELPSSTDDPDRAAASRTRPLAARDLLHVLLPFALYGLAREVDAAVGLLLRTTLDLPGFVREAMALLEPGAVARALLLWIVAGFASWVALAFVRAWREGAPAGGAAWGHRIRLALHEEASGFAPLYLRPALSLLALAALAVRPTYPYGFTLPVALTQDWAVAQEVAIAAALVAWRRPALRLPAPGGASMFLMAFVAYALLSPGAARHWDGHPGNEPKTLRMAVALGHWLTLDVEGVSAGMEALPADPLPRAAARATGTLLRESAAMAAALLRGPQAVGRHAIRATRITRQTIRGKNGGVYHVLAPGPSLLLAPLMRLDRAWNLRQGTAGRLGFTLLFWNALAAALVAALFLLLRELTGRAGLAAALTGLLALLPPFIFYSFQFYPEMLGALALTIALRWLLLVPRWSTRTCWLLGLLLATLPWLHQKFLPVWLVLTAMAVYKAVDRMVSLPALLGLVLPQAVSAWLTALYNFAITGSVRPDALYLAWGPGGVSSARMGQGLLGLLLDARYGLLPYVPIYVIAVGGLLLSGTAAARLRLALPAMLVYYLTVASADNWSGAVCNLGRYIMPVLPWLGGLIALVMARSGRRGGVLALSLMLAGWSALTARALWLDPHAANDCALLLAKSVVADGNVYVPNLFLRSWSEAAPGLAARIAVWMALAALLAAWLRRAASGDGGHSPGRMLAGASVAVLAAALVLERWPGQRNGPRFADAIEAGPGTTAFFTGQAEVEDGRVRAGGGEVLVIVRSRSPQPELRLVVEGQGELRVPGQPVLTLPARPIEVRVPLEERRRLRGRRGVEETLASQRIVVRTGQDVWLHPAP